MGANAGFQRDYTKTKIYCNLLHQARAFCPLTDGGGYGYSNVTLKGDGYPASGTSFIMVFLSNLTDDDAGTYQCSVAGDLTGSGIANAGGGTFSTRVYNAGTNRTTWTVTLVGAGDGTLSIRFNSVPSSFGALEVMCPGYSPGTAQVYRTEVLTHFAPFKTIRFMDWLDTNEPEFPGGTGNTDVNWAGSIAANEDTPMGYRHSLKACIDFCEALGADVWVNIPVSASDAYIDAFVARVVALLPVGMTCYVEYGNEDWNGAFAAYLTIAAAAFGPAGIRAGDDDIVSCSKTGGTATLVLSAPHGKTVGQTVTVGGINNITGGANLVLTSGTTGSTLKWAEAGTATGSLGSDFNSYVFLDPAHALCAPIGSGWWEDGNNALKAKRRYEMTRSRRIWTAIDAADATDRVKVVRGTWMGGRFNEYDVLTWAYAYYGDLSWLYGVSPAYYFETDDPDTGPNEAFDITSVDDVFELLELWRPVVSFGALELGNVCRSWGLEMPAYEGGPHTAIKTGDTAAFVAQAHMDDRMRVFIKDTMQDWRDRGGGLFAYYYAGSNNTFGGTGNNTWALVKGDIEDGPGQAKYQAITQTAAASAVPAEVDGLNSGLIRFVDVLPNGFIAWASNSQYIVNASTRIPNPAIHITAPTDGTYTLTLYAGVTAGTCNVDLLVDGVEVDSANLPVVNVNSVAPGANLGSYTALSVDVELTAGSHTVQVVLPAPTRSGQVGLYGIQRD